MAGWVFQRVQQSSENFLDFFRLLDQEDALPSLLENVSVPENYSVVWGCTWDLSHNGSYMWQWYVLPATDISGVLFSIVIYRSSLHINGLAYDSWLLCMCGRFLYFVFIAKCLFKWSRNTAVCTRHCAHLEGQSIYSSSPFNTLRTGDADLRFYITTMQDGWRRFAFLHYNCAGRVTQICVFNTVKLGSSASSPLCHSTRGNVSRGITPSITTRIFGEYFLKISVHKNC